MIQFALFSFQLFETLYIHFDEGLWGFPVARGLELLEALSKLSREPVLSKQEHCMPLFIIIVLMYYVSHFLILFWDDLIAETQEDEYELQFCNYERVFFAGCSVYKLRLSPSLEKKAKKSNPQPEEVHVVYDPHLSSSLSSSEDRLLK